MQNTSNLLLIRPSNFVFNEETAGSNAFQQELKDNGSTIKEKVFDEFENFIASLSSKGVSPHVFDDTADPIKPDAIFPNNWVSFHPDGTVILYPMYAKNRRYERRRDIVDTLKEKFVVNTVVDLSFYEAHNRYLEGTGSIVFDHNKKIAYACLSPRTDKDLFILLCKRLGYQAIYFYAHDQNGKEIYHTNVMMCIGERFAIICLESISDKNERMLIAEILEETGHEVIEISFEQMNAFAGNMLEIKNDAGEKLLALSKQAFDVLTEDQKNKINQYAELLPLSIHTIETIGGGSARCMIAEIFLENKRIPA